MPVGCVGVFFGVGVFGLGFTVVALVWYFVLFGGLVMVGFGVRLVLLFLVYYVTVLVVFLYGLVWGGCWFSGVVYWVFWVLSVWVLFGVS